ncbi:Uncharacterized [Moorella glycerini]|uniref:Uncharacterized protein n=1 Tax=Neomoorella stamsii TaxID=1266720 RepID=A0A9X7P4S7_9FIRM|nr:hypothetical protein MOST_31580 [Moorella stamsii]CEP67497.1 Uncharacterized [Moorella glycerini]
MLLPNITLVNSYNPGDGAGGFYQVTGITSTTRVTVSWFLYYICFREDKFIRGVG